LYRQRVTSAMSPPRWNRLPDWVLAACLLVVLEVGVATTTHLRPGYRWLAALTMVVAAVPLAWRHRAPVVVWAVCGIATAVGLINHGTDFRGLAVLVALYTVATMSSRRASITTGAVTAAAITVWTIGQRRHGAHWQDFVLPAVVVAAVWLVGDNVRVRRAYVAELEAKAARADLDRAADAARAAAQERARIARELHDVVVHHVSVIAVQAGAARAHADHAGDASSTRQAWATVEGTARTALGELRRLLGLLRSDDEPAALAPAPGTGELERLFDDVRRAGLPVVVRIEGTRDTLPPAVDLSAYRIVQEALTNVLKHAGPVPTTVTLRFGGDSFDVEVTNEAPPLPVPTDGTGGHGLIGMHERVALLGGRLDARPGAHGGFSVVASLPTGAQRA